MQYKVPQNLDIEDKILPFMTMRQLIVCGVGGGFTYLIFLSLEGQSPEIWVPPVGVLGLLTLCIAFVKINDIPFIKYVLLVLERYLNENKRIWLKSAGDVFVSPASQRANAKKEQAAAAKKTQEKQKKKLTPKDIKALSKLLDQK